MIDDFVRDHFKISFTDPDKNGQMVATFSFVDMVALTKRVQTWCGKVLALMEAEGVPGLSIDADRALPLFLSDTAPEAAAVRLIAEARAAAPAPDAVPDPYDERASVPRIPTSPMIQAARYAANLPDGRLAAIWDAMVDAAPAPTMHRAPVEAADAHRPDAWAGADLVTHLRSWPAAPPDADAFSAVYAGGLMTEAADEIERLKRVVTDMRASSDRF